MDHLLHLTRPSGDAPRPRLWRRRADRAQKPRFGSTHAVLSRASGSSGRGSQDARHLGGAAPHGLVSQLVESPLCKREASGSNPDESTLLAVVARGDLDLEKGPLNSTSATHPHGWVAGTPRRPTDNPGQPSVSRWTPDAADAAVRSDGQGPLPADVHTQPGLSRKPKSNLQRVRLQ
jgi:hypothetical protein